MRYLVVDPKDAPIVELVMGFRGKTYAEMVEGARKRLKIISWTAAEEHYFREQDKKGAWAGKVVFVIDEKDILQGEPIEYEFKKRRAEGAWTWFYFLVRKQADAPLHHVRQFIGKPYDALEPHANERFGFIPWSLVQENKMTEELLRGPHFVVFMFKEDGIVQELQFLA